MSIQRYTSEELRQVRAQTQGDIIVGMAAMDISPRRPAYPSARRARHHRNRTPNLLANTSLDENLHALPSREPGQVLCRRQREAIERYHQAMENQEIEDQRLEQQLAAEHEQAQRDAEMAIRRSERHDEHVKGRAAIVSAVDKAVQNWQKSSPSDVKEFMRHYYNAVTISAEPVLVVDILLLLRFHMPDEVRSSLEAASKFYHIDAWLRQDLDQVEHSAYFPEEMVRAARDTEIEKSSAGIEYVRHSQYGRGDNETDHATFQDKYTSKGEEEQRYRFIKASFRIRQVWFEGMVEYRRHFQFPDDKRPYNIMVSWCIKAIKAVRVLPENANIKFVQLADELIEYVDGMQRAEQRILDIKERIEKDLEALFQEYEWDRDTITPERKAPLENVMHARQAKIEADYGPDWMDYLPPTNYRPSDEELARRLPRFDHAEKRALEIEKRVKDGMVQLFREHCLHGRDGPINREDVFSDGLWELKEDLRRKFGEEDWRPHWPDFDAAYDMAFAHDDQYGGGPAALGAPEPESRQG